MTWQVSWRWLVLVTLIAKAFPAISVQALKPLPSISLPRVALEGALGFCPSGDVGGEGFWIAFWKTSAADCCCVGSGGPSSPVGPPLGPPPVLVAELAPFELLV